MTKIIVIAFMIAIIAALGSGLVFLVRDGSQSNRTVKALTWRIVLSFVLIGLLIVGWATGIVHPHNIGH